MNYLDVILALPLLWGIYNGFTKGLIISVATLLALILGVYAAIHFSSFLGVYLDNWFHPNPKYLKALSFSVTFIAVVILVRLVGWALDKFVKVIALGLVNRMLGVFFNLLKWGFILSVLISILNSSELTGNIIKDETKEESLLYKPVAAIAPFVFPYLNFDRLKENFESLPVLSPETKEI